ncbi:methylmalonyl-CoA mutase family protein [Jatrophihabitans sp. DSM 45814]
MTVSGEIGEELPLAADFAPATRSAWQELVSGVLTKSGVKIPANLTVGATPGPESLLATSTYDGFDLTPLYTADDLPARPPLALAVPFEGAAPDGDSTIGWDVRQRHLEADPVRLNEALLTDLENGATSVWLVLGPGGIAVSDLSRALQGVYLDLAPIALQAGGQTSEATEALLGLAAERGVGQAELRGTVGADPIGLFALTGTEPEPELAELIRLSQLLADAPKLRVAEIDASIYHNAGGSDSDELAIAAAVGVAYLRALTAGGLDLAAALRRLEFRYAVTADQFSSIAKLRAARLIWNRIAELSGAEPEDRVQLQHAVTSAAMLTKRDPWVNMLRTTIACFAAAVGGADAITVLPFDSAIGISDDFARRIARNTQSVLHDEASLARVIDPAGGSFYVESLTERLAEVAWEKFTAIERAGGALAALRSGFIPDLLARTREQRDQAIAHRTDAITGVSEFAFVDEPPVARPSAPVQSGALVPVIRYAAGFEELRDRSDAHLAATSQRPRVFLAALGPVAAHSARLGFASNLFPAGGIETVAGTGELADLVDQFRASGSSVACLCSSDRVYAEQAAPTAKALAGAGAKLIYLAGQPGERRQSDAEAGITDYVFTGCDALAVLGSTLAVLLPELEVK